MVLTAEPTTALIRLRGLPWLRADEQLVPVAIYLGDPGELVEGCDVVEVSWSWGAGDDAGVTTAADAGTGVIRLLDPDRKYDPLTPTDSTGIATTVRILVAGPGSATGRYPRGNTGRPNVPATKPMPVPADLAELLAAY